MDAISEYSSNNDELSEAVDDSNDASVISTASRELPEEDFWNTIKYGNRAQVSNEMKMIFHNRTDLIWNTFTGHLCNYCGLLRRKQHCWFALFRKGATASTLDGKVYQWIWFKILDNVENSVIFFLERGGLLLLERYSLFVGFWLEMPGLHGIRSRLLSLLRKKWFQFGRFHSLRWQFAQKQNFAVKCWISLKHIIWSERDKQTICLLKRELLFQWRA